MSMMVWFDLSILSQLSLVPGHQNTPGLTRMFEVTEHQPGPGHGHPAKPYPQLKIGLVTSTSSHK